MGGDELLLLECTVKGGFEVPRGEVSVSGLSTSSDFMKDFASAMEEGTGLRGGRLRIGRGRRGINFFISELCGEILRGNVTEGGGGGVGVRFPRDSTLS